jgi:hypothetical protein
VSLAEEGKSGREPGLSVVLQGLPDAMPPTAGWLYFEDVLPGHHVGPPVGDRKLGQALDLAGELVAEEVLEVNDGGASRVAAAEEPAVR